MPFAPALYPLFTPRAARLQAQALWRDMREVSGGAMLAYRRMQRALVQRRLETAAALITSGGGGGGRGSGPTSSQQARARHGGG